MRERKVEVAVGFADNTWRNIWVTVPQDPNYVLDDSEVILKANDIIMLMGNQNDWNVSFICTIYVEPLEDMDGIL